VARLEKFEVCAAAGPGHYGAQAPLPGPARNLHAQDHQSRQCPASNVSIIHLLPEGSKFHTASNGGRHDLTTRTVTWFVGDLAPARAARLSLEAVPTSVGEQRHRATATAARGLKTEAEAVTHVEGLSALLMDVVDTDDPVEIGADTTYEIRVINSGSKMETNLELVCTVPDKMELRGPSAWRAAASASRAGR